MSRLLIIEDDQALSNGITLALQNTNIKIAQCYDIRTAQAKLLEEQYDLIILDVNLPDGNGLDLLKEIKDKTDIAVIILTANDMETDIVAGLEMGVDDYMTKPFSLAVLRARVNTQLRRNNTVKPYYFRQDGLNFDFEQMEYLKNKKVIELSKTEQKLLKILVENKGITLPRSVLVDRIWTSGAEYVDENALSVTIKRLRDKLEDIPSTPRYIKTVYGIGYTWVG
ncbi:MAG: response regulator transcription factor [Niameybacter sp.]|uniref:response regulator transcription factor n=1 Tax=Niameybacter sp. TaxID=2033640 RepID=UPI002FC8F6E3